MCSPVQDMVRDTILLGVLVALAVVLIVMLLSCSCACCKYRRLKYQYYEKANLIRNRDPGRGGSENSVERDVKGSNKRDVIYKIGDEDD